MRLPAGIRTDLLEFIGASPMADDQLDRMLRDMDLVLKDQRRHGRIEALV